MSKKLSTVLLTAVMLILILSGCGCEHEVVFDEGYPASCTQDGLSDGEHCALCGKVLKKQEIIHSTGHVEERLPETEPTCTEPGLTWGKVCSVCGEILVPQEKNAEPLGHDFEDGVCVRCGEKIPIWNSEPLTNEFGDETGEFIILNQVAFNTDDTFYDEAYSAVDGTDEMRLMYVHRGALNSSYEYFFSSLFKVLIRQGGGEASELIGWGYGNYISIPFEEDRELFLNYLSGDETVDIYVEGHENPDEHYLFSARPDNFAELYEEIYGQG